MEEIFDRFFHKILAVMIVLLSLNAFDGRKCLKKSSSILLDGLKHSVRNGRGEILKSTYARGEGHVKSVRVCTRGGGSNFGNFDAYVLNERPYMHKSICSLNSSA